MIAHPTVPCLSTQNRISAFGNHDAPLRRKLFKPSLRGFHGVQGNMN
jgi:hypothetical protein